RQPVRRVESLESWAKKVLDRLGGRVAANKQKPANERRQMQVSGEGLDRGGIRLRGKNPARFKARTSGRCGHPGKLLGTRGSNKLIALHREALRTLRKSRFGL